MARGEIAAARTLSEDIYQHEANNGTHGFYSHIRQQFGNQTLQLLKQFSRMNVTLMKQKNRRIFLLRCKHLELTPTFINFNVPHINLQCKYLNDEFKSLTLKFKLKTLDLTISDTCKNIRSLTKKLTDLKNNITSVITHDIFSQYLNFENKKF